MFGGTVAKIKLHAAQHRRKINTDLYQRFLYVVQYSNTNREAAERLGVSTSTIRRWKRDGISNRASQNKEIVHKIRRSSGAIRGYIAHTPEDHRTHKEFRPVYYYRYEGGARSKIWRTKGASFEQLLEIVLRECARGGYTGFSYLTEFKHEWEGFITEENEFIDLDDLSELSKREQKLVRDNSSFISVNMDDPYIASHTQMLLPHDCHPDNFIQTLNNIFNKQFLEVVNIKFNEPRDYLFFNQERRIRQIPISFERRRNTHYYE